MADKKKKSKAKVKVKIKGSPGQVASALRKLSNSKPDEGFGS